jgi:hypothetical protein
VHRFVPAAVDSPWYLAPRLGCRLEVSRLDSSASERVVNGLREAASPRLGSVHSQRRIHRGGKVGHGPPSILYTLLCL